MHIVSKYGYRTFIEKHFRNLYSGSHREYISLSHVTFRTFRFLPIYVPPHHTYNDALVRTLDTRSSTTV